ncbi:a-type inclusion protein [Anaeramoeba flamelloides]|uniref:A-type inclusion protein n=1 Tax=Anaeramoeba flamelloides TaxID=1746091 RepID=A0AAV7YD99_9EUKA|nr:a-type inclusion protein [Anaeramoeba flamelloides]
MNKPKKRNSNPRSFGRTDSMTSILQKRKTGRISVIRQNIFLWVKKVLQNSELEMGQLFHSNCIVILNLLNIISPTEQYNIKLTNHRPQQIQENLYEFQTTLTDHFNYPKQSLFSIPECLNNLEAGYDKFVNPLKYLKDYCEKNGIQKNVKKKIRYIIIRRNEVNYNSVKNQNAFYDNENQFKKLIRLNNEFFFTKNIEKKVKIINNLSSLNLNNSDNSEFSEDEDEDSDNEIEKKLIKPKRIINKEINSSLHEIEEVFSENISDDKNLNYTNNLVEYEQETDKQEQKQGRLTTQNVSPSNDNNQNNPIDLDQEQTFKDTLNELNKKINQIEIEKEKLSNEKKEIGKLNERLANEKKELENFNEQLSNEKNELEYLNEKLIKEKNEIKKEKEDQELKINELNVIIKQNEVEKKKLTNEKINEIKNLKEKLANEKIEIENLNEKLNIEIKEQESKTQGIIKKEKEDMVKKLDALTKKINELNVIIKQNEVEKKKLTNEKIEIQKLNEQLANEKIEIGNLNEKLKNEKIKIENLNEKLNNEIKEQVLKTQGIIKKEKEEKENKFNEFNNKINELKGKMKQNEVENGKLKKEKIEIENFNEKLKNEKMELENLNDKYRKELEDQKQKFEEKIFQNENDYKKQLQQKEEESLIQIHLENRLKESEKKNLQDIKQLSQQLQSLKNEKDKNDQEQLNLILQLKEQLKKELPQPPKEKCTQQQPQSNKEQFLNNNTLEKENNKQLKALDMMNVNNNVNKNETDKNGNQNLELEAEFIQVSDILSDEHGKEYTSDNEEIEKILTKESTSSQTINPPKLDVNIEKNNFSGHIITLLLILLLLFCVFLILTRYLQNKSLYF